MRVDDPGAQQQFKVVGQISIRSPGLVMESGAALSLDHVFLAVSKGGPEVGPLEAAGFTEGAQNVHPGQGTACRRFFFGDRYLEFIWLENRAEAYSTTVLPTALGDRLGGAPGASRIGICIRLSPDQPVPPVATWPYRPAYLPPPFAIPMARSSDRRREPLLFFVPAGLGKTTTEPDHPNGARSITDVAIVLPGAIRPSPELEWLTESGLVRIERGAEEALSVELDGGARGERLVLMGGSPLELTW